MIRYALACDAGHRFESWFHDSAAFDDLADRALISCPTCSSSKVDKAIMAPAVVADRGRPTSAPAEGANLVDISLMDERRRGVRERLKAFREKVLAETTDVGDRFPEEARRMHEGKIPRNEIRGQATLDEAKSLLEEGIMILPLPVLPEELN